MAVPGAKSPFRFSWFLFILALLIALAGLVMAIVGARPLWLIPLCPVAWALVFGGLLHSNRTARRIREGDKQCSEPSSGRS